MSDDGATESERRYRELIQASPAPINVFDESTMGPTFHSAGMGLWFVSVVVRESGGTVQFHEHESGGNAVCIELPSGTDHWNAES